MPAKKRRDAGSGTIRQRADGRWEGRYTVGYDPETGKQIMRSVYAKTKREVREKLNKTLMGLYDRYGRNIVQTGGEMESQQILEEHKKI